MSVLADRSFVFIHAIEGHHQIIQGLLIVRTMMRREAVGTRPLTPFSIQTAMLRSAPSVARMGTVACITLPSSRYPRCAGLSQACTLGWGSADACPMLTSGS